MGKGINIEFVSDVKGVLRGTSDIEGALDDVSGALDDVTRDAAKTGDKIGDELKDGGEKGEKAAKDLERKFRDAFDDVKGKSRKAGDDMGDNVKRGAGRAEQAVGEFKEEAKQNFAETASSFDGSMESIADLAQSTFGGLAGSIPGIGIALAGLGAAAGAFYAQWSEKTEATKQLVADMYDDMLASGNEFLSKDFINQRVSEVVKDDELVRQYGEAARTIGVDLATAVRAAAGDQEAMNAVTQAAAKWQAEYGDAAGSTNVAVGSLTEAIRDQESSLTSASAKQELARSAMVTTAEAAADWASAQAEVDDIVKDSTNGILDNAKAFKGNAEQLRTENLSVLGDMATRLGDVNQAAADAGVSGEDLAAVQRRQYDAFVKAAEGAGLSRDSARGLAEDYGLLPREVETEVSTTGVPAARRSAQDVKADLDALGPVSVPITVTMPTQQSIRSRLAALGVGLEVEVPISVRAPRSGTVVP